ncbi:MAG: 50S ribosomal protein L23 [Candidatus Njordarchaeia archaeon]
MAKKGSGRIRKRAVSVEDKYKVIIRAEVTEKTIRMIQEENKLVFLVDRNANKHQIKRAIEELFDVEIEKINTMITSKGYKKAIVKLSPEFSALDLATNLGML